jgi:N-acetyl-anhydromuramyl-L-alanine amidase AmpD
MSDLGYPMIQAHPDTWDQGRQGYSIIWVIVHCTAQAYQDDYPYRLGQYWSRPPTGSPVSVHYGISDTQVYQYVWHADTAYQARNPGNLRGVGIEFSGLASYPPSEWLSHGAMLRHGGKLVSEIAAKHRIPLKYCSDDDLRERRPGITTHAQLTRVFGGTHTDPGPGFPLDLLLQYAQGVPQPTQEDDMGRSFPPMPIPLRGGTSANIPPVQQGDADPCYCWVNVANDTRGQKYALRFAIGDANGWNIVFEKKIFDSRERMSYALPPGIYIVDLERVPVAQGEPVYEGNLTWCLERKPI